MSALETRHRTAPTVYPPRFVDVLRSEFIKLGSLRSTISLLLAIVALGLAISSVLGVTAESSGAPDEPSVGFMLDQVTIGTVLFGQLLAGVLGVLIISGEYSSGTIQSTLLAVPARGTVVAAKVVVVFFAVTAAALVAMFGSWAVTYPMLAGLGIEVGLTAPGVLSALIGGSVYVGLSAVLGVGIGALLRSVAAGVATVLSIILLLPLVLSVLPASSLVRNSHLLSMSKAGDAMSSAPDEGGVFMDLADGYVSSPAGWLVATTWAGVLLLMGFLQLRRKDV